MHLNPSQSRKAHPQIRKTIEAAASSNSHPQDSLARGHCDLRGSQRPSSDRGVDGRQPFGPIGNPRGRALRPFRKISRRHLEAILTPRPRWAVPASYSLPARDPALGGKIGISIMTLAVAFVGALLACGGIPR